MGVVQSQSLKNTIITYLGFGFGAINTLFLYTNEAFITEQYYGLMAYILSTANMLMPLFAFGVHNTLIKFYSSYKSKTKINSFLTLMLFLPLLMIIPIGFFGHFIYELIANYLSQRNIIIKDYVWLIYIAAIAFAYFEIFYAWTKVHLNSVFGNFMKEVFHRIGISILLVCLYFKWLTVNQFIYSVVGVYFLRMLLMKLYAYYVRKPVFQWSRLHNFVEIIKYSALIIIAGSIATVILDVDKFMLGQFIEIEKVAYYSVAIFIATVISVPARSMYQITNPLTAQLLNENKYAELDTLYKKSSLNLFIISGFIFLLIMVNINQLYVLIPEQYTGGLIVVLLVGIAKLSDNLMGNNNAILFNSNYYKMALFFGVLIALTAVVLNLWLIPIYEYEGAALATFISILTYNVIKLSFVYFKFGMIPFTAATFKAFILIFVFLGLFYFWELSFHPILNITLKSFAIGLCYLFVVYKMNFSEDISKLIDTQLKRF
ncbi:MAG: oligosaccharide flippase family protein [Flavobacteriaceae bacterium]|nr:oligosaccharide flippase family protein [Flavobacteriaceae bacterium]